MSVSRIRKQIFDYLTANLTNVEIVIQHPTAVDETKAKIVVEPLRDSIAGRYTSEEINNPDIRITMYAGFELTLTKPTTGLVDIVESLMKNFCPEPRQNFQKINDFYPGYFDDGLLYRSHLTYRFYGDLSVT